MPDDAASLKFPKPTPRVRDAKFIASYRSRIRQCECGCRSNRALEFHHIVSRKMSGGDVESNALMLAAGCHARWHTIGGRAFYRERAGQMSDEARRKIEVALRLEAE
jgi:hypothetical protein